MAVSLSSGHSLFVSLIPTNPIVILKVIGVATVVIGALACAYFFIPQFREFCWHCVPLFLRVPVTPRAREMEAPMVAAATPSASASLAPTPSTSAPMVAATPPARTPLYPSLAPVSPVSAPMVAAAIPSASASSAPMPPASAPMAPATVVLAVKSARVAIEMSLRKPLTDFLSQNQIACDERGLPLAGAVIPEALKGELNRDTPKTRMLAQCFYDVAHNGAGGYAHDLCTFFAGLGVAGPQVRKWAGVAGFIPLTDPCRPHSYATGRTGIQVVPKDGKGKSSYVSAFSNAVSEGYKQFRIEHFSIQDKKKKGQDQELTVEQQAHYEASVGRIKELHHTGYLLGRVASKEEAKELAAHRPSMGNDILSTTLWPAEHSPVEIQLFCEYGQETVGLLLDSRCASAADFGRAFMQNAGTAGSGFLKHKAQRTDGATTLEAQHALLEAYQSEVSQGGSVHSLNVTLKKDQSGWDVQKQEARHVGEGRQGRFGIQAGNKVSWNEMTFYRGVSGDLLTGLFIKSDSDSFSEELKRLLEVQDHIRRTKGRFLPIFRFDGKKNTLIEIPPDELILSIVGLHSTIPAFKGRESALSKALSQAGITVEDAVQMRKALPTTGNLKDLFDLQLLMFNLQDITGTLSVLQANHHSGGHTYDPIRIIDNLHLVFPNIHRSQNTTAKRPELHFSLVEAQLINQTPALKRYLSLAIAASLQRFLGIRVNSGDQTVTFDEKILDLFDAKDPKNLDFAKVLSRAVQTAVLFDVFSSDTVFKIVQAVRRTRPVLGFLPDGTDMLLGSEEVQAIQRLKSTPYFPCQLQRTASAAAGAVVPVTPFNYKVENVNPLKGVALPSEEDILTYLQGFGITKTAFDRSKLTDPSLAQAEPHLVKALRFLRICNADLASAVVINVRKVFPYFGWSSTRIDLTRSEHDLLTRWLSSTGKKSCEFPFTSLAAVAGSQEPVARAGVVPIRTRGGEFVPSERGARFVPRARGEMAAASEESVETKNGSQMIEALNKDPQTLQGLSSLVPVPTTADRRDAVARRLGLIDAQGKWLWTNPSPADLERPAGPYLQVTDMAGKCTSALMTGPAYSQDKLREDQQSVRVYYVPSRVKPQEVERLVTDTLAVTTDGDAQVVRANGTQYCRSVRPPMGGGIKYNAANEMYRFRNTETLQYLRHVPDAGVPAPAKGSQYDVHYPGMGAYSKEELDAVQKYDQMLLSDRERRIKSASLVVAGRITVTAKGGYGSEREPLEKASRVLCIGTYGPQFEKYNKGVFQALDGSRDDNELEAADFIIKKGAVRNNSPLFPRYYAGGAIPGNTEVVRFSTLGDRDWNADFVKLSDGAFFNRGAFARATQLTLEERVGPIIKHNCKDKPFYLKATLFGGGFFTQIPALGISLREEVVHAMLNGYVHMMEQDRIPKGSVLEFPRYGALSALDPLLRQRLLTTAKEKGVHLVWTEEGDLCDFSPKQTVQELSIDPASFEKEGTLVLLNAGDAMSWFGNEASSASVEAMLGNNSNLRLVFNWWANPGLLDPKTHIPLGRA